MFHKNILMQLKNLELSLEKVKQMLQDKMTKEQNLNESKFWCRSLANIALNIYGRAMTNYAFRLDLGIHSFWLLFLHVVLILS
jgi:hypothetical protein